MDNTALLGEGLQQYGEALRGSNSGIRCGPGVVLIPFEKVASQWEPFGLDEEGFLLLLNSVGCPVLTLPNGVRLINLYSFQVGLGVVTRAGAEPFDAGCDIVDGNTLAENFKTVLEQLHQIRKFSGTNITKKVREDFEVALNCMALRMAKLVSSTQH